jgi:hypothetical protein
MVKRGIPPEQEILTRHFAYFGHGPLPEGLLKIVNSETWVGALKGAADAAEKAVKDQPDLAFEVWGEGLGVETQNMITGITNLDPTARTTIDQVLAHRCWHQDD